MCVAGNCKLRSVRSCVCRCLCRLLVLVLVLLLGVGAYMHFAEDGIVGQAYSIANWFGTVLDGLCENNVPVHDVDIALPWAAAVRHAYPDIRREYEEYLQEIGTKPRLYGEHGFDLDGTGTYIDRQRGWRSLFLRCYSLDTEVAKRFRETHQCSTIIVAPAACA